MTDEEIQKCIIAIPVNSICYCESRGSADRKAHKRILAVVPSLIRTARREAVEECAQTAEQWGASDDEPTDPDVAFSCLTAAIRALAEGDK